MNQASSLMFLRPYEKVQKKKPNFTEYERNLYRKKCLQLTFLILDRPWEM